MCEVVTVSPTQRVTVGRLILTIYFVEVGMLLLVAPWTQYWERNFFLEIAPWLQDALTSSFARGVVSGAGGITLVVGAVDVGWLAARIAGRHRHSDECG